MSSYTEGLHITDNPACNEFMREEWGNFPRIQFDRNLGAELALGETVDIAEESLKKYFEYAGIPRDRWGDLSIVVTGAESSSYLRGAELGHVRKDESNERGLEVVVEADYYTDFDATLQHELCHVKDIMDGKIDLERKRRSSLVYPYCMYTNSEEKRGIVRDFLALCHLSAASLAAYLKGTSLKKYYDSPEEQRACEAEEKGGTWLSYALVRRISAEFENEIAPFLSHPWTSVQTGGDEHKVWAMQEAARQLGLSCYTTTDPEEVEMLAIKRAERFCCGYAKSARSTEPVRSKYTLEAIDEEVDRFMGYADTAIKNGGAVMAIVPGSIRGIGLGAFSKRYYDIENWHY